MELFFLFLTSAECDANLLALSASFTSVVVMLGLVVVVGVVASVRVAKSVVDGSLHHNKSEMHSRVYLFGE